MSKTINTLFAAGALVAGTAFVTATVVGDDHEGHGSPEMDAMMGKWMEYMTPGDEHKEMAHFVGHWTMTTRMWMDPNMDPETSTNKVAVKPIMGGRFLMEQVQGEPDAMMPGMTFEGLNILGYDNHRKMYAFSWIDNMGTGIFTGTGSANAAGNEITYMSEAPDLLNPGQMKPVKSVTRLIDNDHHLFEMWEINESGEWWKSFEGEYVRQGKADGKGMDTMHGR